MAVSSAPLHSRSGYNPAPPPPHVPDNAPEGKGAGREETPGVGTYPELNNTQNYKDKGVQEEEGAFTHYTVFTFLSADLKLAHPHTEHMRQVEVILVAYLLWRNIKRYSSQVYLHILVDAWENEEHTCRKAIEENTYR